MARGGERPVPAMGPLKVHPFNPRYFTDGSGKAIYLTGSHHWHNLQDGAEVGHPIRAFDYSRYLDLLEASHHNFMRMWAWEGGVNHSYSEPLPYARTGPGMALDGKPKFDLERFDEAYFDRLRSRVIAARVRGIYVGIMLFNGWSIYDHGHGNPWPRHPFNAANNINGINGDPDGDGEGKEVHTLHVPAITALQEAYVRKVVDTVNDLDNVLYEITNETAIFSKAWQYHMIRYIRDYEAAKPKQHPVGMTSFDATPEQAGREGAIDALFASPADWVSPCNDGTVNYAVNPPPATGKKVVISDTDHIFGVGGDQAWVWKTFTRGLNSVYMDPLHDLIGVGSEYPNAGEARKAMGYTLSYAMKMNLAAMAPRPDLCSTTYCLANPGFEYLVYLPFGSHRLEAWIDSIPDRRPYRRIKVWLKSLHVFRRTVTLDLSPVSRALSVEWFNPTNGETIAAGITTGGGNQTFTAPFRGDAVLYLEAR